VVRGMVGVGSEQTYGEQRSDGKIAATLTATTQKGEYRRLDHFKKRQSIGMDNAPARGGGGALVNKVSLLIFLLRFENDGMQVLHI